MAIKSLLIAYNGGDASDSALHLALQMANKYDAHLTGIAGARRFQRYTQHPELVEPHNA